MTTPLAQRIASVLEPRRGLLTEAAAALRTKPSTISGWYNTSKGKKRPAVPELPTFTAFLDFLEQLGVIRADERPDWMNDWMAAQAGGGRGPFVEGRWVVAFA